MRLCASCLLSLPSFFKCNDCLGLTAEETLRKGREERLGGHRRPEGQEWSLHDCRRAGWALGCRPADSIVCANLAACAYRACREQTQEHGPLGRQPSPEELLLPFTKQSLHATLAAACAELVPSCRGCIPTYPVETTPAKGRWLP